MSDDIDIDLAECAREPIHVPGGIQAYGALLACDDDLIVLQASANLAEFAGTSAGDARGRTVAALLGPTAAVALARRRDESRADLQRGVDVEAGGRALRATVHRHQGATLIELEPRGQGEEEAEPLAALSVTLARLQGAATLDDLWRVVAAEVRAITGFERVLVYRFAADGSGHVVAESRLDELESYLDLHYPASDIPEQARRLYLLNRLRLIPDARHTPVPLEPLCRPDTGAPLDLTYANLRAVSPMHLAYMGNMGVRASMSISVVIGGKLWGLINCGSRTPRLASAGARSACELIGRMTSLQIGAMEEMATAAARGERAERSRQLVEAIRGHIRGGPAGASAVMSGLASEPQGLLRLCDAGGVALRYGGQWTTFGEVPPPEGLAVIDGWLETRFGANDDCAVVSTDSLARELPAAEAFSSVASGLLAFAMPRPLTDRVLWFRPELIQTVKWGGDPTKRVDPASGRLGPRRSFELWKETVRATSFAWDRSVLDAADDLRRHCIEIDLALHVALVDAALEARDDMVAVVSHDLRNPISVVQMSAGTIWRLTSGPSEPMLRVRAAVERIQRAVETMNALVHDLLDVDKIQSGRFSVRVQAENARGLVEDAVDMMRLLAAHKRIDISVDAAESSGALVVADAERVFQVLSNLLGNAVKFTPDDGHIRLRVTPLDGEVEFRVHDDGPGIPEQMLPRMFDRHWQERQHAGGTGLGLFIARGIVEAHRGRIWAESVVGQGTTVCFTLPAA